MGLYDGAFCFTCLFIFFKIISPVYVYENLPIYRTYDINAVYCVDPLANYLTFILVGVISVCTAECALMSFSIYVHCFIYPFPVYVFIVYSLDIMWFVMFSNCNIFTDTLIATWLARMYALILLVTHLHMNNYKIGECQNVFYVFCHSEYMLYFTSFRLLLLFMWMNVLVFCLFFHSL